MQGSLSKDKDVTVIHPLVIKKVPVSDDEKESLLISGGPSREVMTDEDRHSSFYLQKVVTPCCTCLCCPFVCCFSWTQIDEGHHLVVLRWGQYVETKKTAGCHFINCIGFGGSTISTKKQSHNLPSAKMVDKNGNPIVVSGVLVYSVENAQRALLNVENYILFVHELACTTLKQVVSRFPYESSTDHKGQDKHEPSLKTEAYEISQELVNTLQKKVSHAGIRIHTFEFDELSYAPEIASQMLKRQQAVALVQARHQIVEGAVDTAWGAIQRLASAGVVMSDGAREKLVGNLLTVMVSDRETQPTVAVGGH